MLREFVEVTNVCLVDPFVFKACKKSLFSNCKSHLSQATER
jgi:hypothetical protein